MVTFRHKHSQAPTAGRDRESFAGYSEICAVLHDHAGQRHPCRSSQARFSQAPSQPWAGCCLDQEFLLL